MGDLHPVKGAGKGGVVELGDVIAVFGGEIIILRRVVPGVDPLQGKIQIKRAVFHVQRGGGVGGVVPAQPLHGKGDGVGAVGIALRKDRDPHRAGKNERSRQQGGKTAFDRLQDKDSFPGKRNKKCACLKRQTQQKRGPRPARQNAVVHAFFGGVTTFFSRFPGLRIGAAARPSHASAQWPFLAALPAYSDRIARDLHPIPSFNEAESASKH